MAVRNSSDYEKPDTDVSRMRDPVTLPTNMARQGENKGNMAKVLMAGTALAIVFMFAAYYMSWV